MHSGKHVATPTWIVFVRDTLLRTVTKMGTRDESEHQWGLVDLHRCSRQVRMMQLGLSRRVGAGSGWRRASELRASELRASEQRDRRGVWSQGAWPQTYRGASSVMSEASGRHAKRTGA